MFKTRCLTAASAVIALAAFVAPVQGQTGNYPAQTIKVIVPFAPGGGVDAYARILAQQIKEKRKIDIIVENRPGSNGAIGGVAVLRAEPNGYTVLFSASTHVMARQVMKSAPYDPVTDFSAIARVGEAPMLVVMSPNRPEKGIPDVLASAKSDPAKWNFAASALGSMGHLATIAFGHLGGVKFTIIPYKGTAPGLNDVAAGHVQLMIDPVIALLPMASAGKVRALAVTTAKRTSLAPEIPTAAEAGMPGLEFSSWYGVWGQKDLPAPILAWLNAAFNEAVTDLAASGRLAKLGIEPASETPEQFRAYIAKDVARNAELLRLAGFAPN